MIQYNTAFRGKLPSGGLRSQYFEQCGTGRNNEQIFRQHAAIPRNLIVPHFHAGHAIQQLAALLPSRNNIGRQTAIASAQRMMQPNEGEFALFAGHLAE